MIPCSSMESVFWCSFVTLTDNVHLHYFDVAILWHAAKSSLMPSIPIRLKLLPARRCAIAVLAMALRLSVCLSACLSQAGVILQRLKGPNSFWEQIPTSAYLTLYWKGIRISLDFEKLRNCTSTVTSACQLRLARYDLNCVESAVKPQQTGQLKPRPHQQQRRSNIAECYKSNDSFDEVERCFDIVAVLTTVSNEVSSFRQNRNKLIAHVQFVSTLLKGRNFTIYSFDIVAGVDGA